jgi:hypothetical protein
MMIVLLGRVVCLSLRRGSRNTSVLQRPFAIPVQTLFVRDASPNLDVEAAEDLLDCDFDPAEE